MRGRAVIGAVLGLSGCMIGGRDTRPSIVHRTHDSYVPTSGRGATDGSSRPRDLPGTCQGTVSWIAFWAPGPAAASKCPLVESRSPGMTNV